MKCVINNQVVLSRPLEGPLAAHIGPFASGRASRDMRCTRFTGRYWSPRVSAGGLDRTA